MIVGRFAIVEIFKPRRPLNVAAIQGQSHVMLIFCVCRPVSSSACTIRRRRRLGHWECRARSLHPHDVYTLSPSLSRPPRLEVSARKVACIYTWSNGTLHI